MAAVAARVLGAGAPAWPDLVRPEHVAVPPALEARARFMAALYTRHWIATDEPAPAFAHWIDAALDASAEVAETMRGYLATRFAPPAALLFSARQQELFGSVGRSERHIWSAPHLDPEAMREVSAALGRRGHAVAGEAEEALVRHHAVRDRPLDLLGAAYQWGLTDQPRANSSLRHNPPAFYAARTPRSHFALVVDSPAPLRLELAARLPVVEQPREGELSVWIDGRPAARVPLGGAWQRHVIELPAALLRRGINRLTLEWPPLPAEGDAALRRIGRRLDQRVGVDIHPVFGELMTLGARRSAPA
jgi:hypothetical protein